MSLEKLVEKYFAPKKGNDLLIKLLEGKLNEQMPYIGVPQITPAIGKAGHPGMLDSDGNVGDSRLKKVNEYIRTVMATPFINSLKNDNSIFGRIRMINDFLEGDDSITIPEFVAISTFIQEFSKIIREYDTADKQLGGYQFEMLMSVFFDGVELFGRGITDFKAAVNGKQENVSVKFIKFQPEPDISGNIKNFISETFSNTRLVYLVCLKDIPNGRYHFFEIPVLDTHFDEIFNWDSQTALMFFGWNPQINFKEFQTRGSAETVQEYRERLLQRIEEVVAAYKARSLPIRIESENLFSKRFSSYVFTPSSENYAGTLDFSPDKLKGSYDFYKEKILGQVGELLNLASLVNKDMIMFFSKFEDETESKVLADKIFFNISKLNIKFTPFWIKKTKSGNSK
jgi:hypothetical protein